MLLGLTNTETYETQYLESVESFSYDGLELCITFSEDHPYSSIDEILRKLPNTINQYNFHFKGVDMWSYERLQEGSCYLNGMEIKLRDDGRTDLLAVIPGIRVFTQG